MKFCDLRSAGAEWGTKLKLVKEPTNSTVYCGLGPWDNQGVGSEKNRPLGLDKKWMVGSVKIWSNSKTRNTP